MKKILVVDDEKSIRVLCEEELRQDGYDVISTGTCHDVQDLIVSANPSVLVLDVRLDECDAFEFLEEIREKRASLPIILYTAYDSYRNDARYTAADYYVLKSFDLTGLKAAITDAVGSE